LQSTIVAQSQNIHVFVILPSCNSATIRKVCEPQEVMMSLLFNLADTAYIAERDLIDLSQIFAHIVQVVRSRSNASEPLSASQILRPLLTEPLAWQQDNEAYNLSMLCLHSVAQFASWRIDTKDLSSDAYVFSVLPPILIARIFEVMSANAAPVCVKIHSLTPLARDAIFDSIVSDID
jgi:hypothetical protein